MQDVSAMIYGMGLERLIFLKPLMMFSQIYQDVLKVGLGETEQKRFSLLSGGRFCSRVQKWSGGELGSGCEESGQDVLPQRGWHDPSGPAGRFSILLLPHWVLA